MKNRKLDLQIFSIFTLSLSYATIRYIILGDVPWSDFPLFIMNKAFSLSSVLLLLFSIFKKERNRIYSVIFFFASIHGLISFRLLGNTYFPNFYSDLTINLWGYFALGFGILSYLIIFIFKSDGVLPTEDGKLVIPIYIKNILLSLLPLVLLLHIFTIGIRGWIKPEEWHGYLVPVSLIAFIALVSFVFQRRKKIPN